MIGKLEPGRRQCFRDWELWRKLSKRHNFLYIDRPLACYRWHDSNSVKVMNGKLVLDDVLNLVKKTILCEHGLIALWRIEYAPGYYRSDKQNIPLSENYHCWICWNFAAFILLALCDALVRKIVRAASEEVE